MAHLAVYALSIFMIAVILIIVIAVVVMLRHFLTLVSTPFLEGLAIGMFATLLCVLISAKLGIKVV